ncbi:hypothetical protein ACVXG7_20495 [Enterobacter hormaechei]
MRDGDMIRVNGQTGELTLLVDEAELAARQPHIPDLSASAWVPDAKCLVRCVRTLRCGAGRNLYYVLRRT